MKYIDLPSPGALSNSLRLRKELAIAVSYVERQAARRSAVPDQLVTLRASLQAAVTRLTAVETAVNA